MHFERGYSVDGGDCDSFGDLTLWWWLTTLVVKWRVWECHSSFDWQIDWLMILPVLPDLCIIRISVFNDSFLGWLRDSPVDFFTARKTDNNKHFLTIKYFTCAKRCFHWPYIDCFIILSLLLFRDGAIIIDSLFIVCVWAVRWLYGCGRHYYHHFVFLLNSLNNVLNCLLYAHIFYSYFKRSVFFVPFLRLTFMETPKPNLIQCWYYFISFTNFRDHHNALKRWKKAEEFCSSRNKKTTN